MIHTKLPYNPILDSMSYHNEVITIVFKKQNYKRSYNINMLLAYKLFYSKTAAECLKTFNEIKKLCPVINVQVL
jgi:hypothetical protein